jgi:integrase
MTRTALRQQDIAPLLARLDTESRALASFILESGARLSEALAAQVGDIGPVDGRGSVPVLIHGVKGGGERISFLTAETACTLRARIPDRPAHFKPSPPHKICTDGPSAGLTDARLFPRGRRWYQRRFQRAGFDARSLRHTFCTALLSNGADLITTMMLMGHKRCHSTHFYWDLTEPRLRALEASIATSLPRVRRFTLAHPDLWDDIQRQQLDP